MFVGAVVERHRLDEQHGAAGREVLTRVPGDAHRVAHVVQAVEEADEVVASPRTPSRSATSNSVLPSTPASFARCLARLDRRRVEVEPVDRRVRVGLGHHHDRRTVPATDVGDARASSSRSSTPSSAGIHVDVRNARYPGRKNHSVPRNRHWWWSPQLNPPSPRNASASRLAVDHHRHERVHAARHERRRRLVGEHHRDLVGHRVGVGAGVVRDDPGRGLAVEPLAREPRVAAGRCRPRRRRVRAARAGERPVVPELVAQPDGRARSRHPSCGRPADRRTPRPWFVHLHTLARGVRRSAPSPCTA